MGFMMWRLLGALVVFPVSGHWSNSDTVNLRCQLGAGHVEPRGAGREDRKERWQVAGKANQGDKKCKGV